MFTISSQELLGGGVWTAKIKKKMREKYFISRSQFVKMEAPSLKGTRLNTAVKSVDVSGASKTLLVIHQGVRDRVKLAWGGKSPLSPWVP